MAPVELEVPEVAHPGGVRLVLTRGRDLAGIVRGGGLEALIARESALRLAALGGTEKKLRGVPRRRPGAA